MRPVFSTLLLICSTAQNKLQVKALIIILLTFLYYCYASVCLAQQINIKTYTIEDGLVNNDILNIYQDSRGFIWLCTRGGLSRYDGTRFTNYTTSDGLSNDMINDIYEIAPQKFIIAQNSDGPKLLENGYIKTMLPRSNLTVNKFYTIDNKRLLAATDYLGIMEWKNDHFQPVNSSYKESIGRMSVLNDSLWAIAQIAYDVQLITSELKPYSLKSKLDATIVFTDSHHRTWAGAAKGLRLLDTLQQRDKNISFIPLPASFNLPILRESYISDFLEDSRGNCWIGTSEGLVQIQPNGTSRIFTKSDGLPMSTVNCVLEDRQNNIWIGTALGLAKFSLINEVNLYSLNNGLSGNNPVFISPLTENRIRIFNGIKMDELDLGTRQIKSNLSNCSSTCRAYRIGSGEFLVSEDNTGRLFKDGVEHIKTINLPHKYFDYAARIDSATFLVSIDGYLFITTNGSELKKINIQFNSQVTVFTPLKNDMLWIGTWQSGVYKMKLHRNQDNILFELIDSVTNDLPDRFIRALYTTKESELWIGTRYKGLVRLLENGNGKKEIQNYGTTEGLSSNFIRAINRDQKGNIWAGSMQGIDKLIPYKNGYRVFNFGKINKIFAQVHDICFLKDGYLLAAGFPYLIHARDLRQDTLPAPAVFITKVYTGLNASSATEDNRRTRLPHNKAQIYFEFSAPEFINEDFTEYSYRLVGSNDTIWTTAGKSRSVYFASLQPGNYIFEVKALGFNGKWGQASIYPFIVSTPFWRQPWFILLVIVAIALLVYVLYRYRIQQLIRLQKVRNRIATDLHDEIGSNLTNISILSNLSKKNISHPQQANDFLQRISEEVSSSSQALDDIIWSVNSSHDTLEETVARMRRYAAELFDAANISYDLQLDPAFEEKKLIMEQRRDIYLLYKEAINNIFKHADAKEVIIKIAVEHNHLLLHIKDDGKGFETDKNFHRHGLQGMKERVKRWNGKIQIESAKNNGTSILIQIPVEK